MTNEQQHTIKALKRLIEVCEDGNRGYKNAADHIGHEHEELKTVLYRLSQQRALFEAELKDEIRHFGGDMDEDTSILGTLHRTWIDIKSRFRSDELDAILEECMRGDKAAVEAYEAGLKAHLPQYLREKVESQYKLIKGTRAQLAEFQKAPDA